MPPSESPHAQPTSNCCMSLNLYFISPGRFPQLFLTVVTPKSKADTIYRVTQRPQSLSPDAQCLLMGDFNDRKWNNWSFTGTSPAQLEKIRFQTCVIPPSGSSDHSTIHLTPVYRPTLEREKVRTGQVKIWSEDAGWGKERDQSGHEQSQVTKISSGKIKAARIWRQHWGKWRVNKNLETNRFADTCW